jgi:hypothetical protein
VLEAYALIRHEHPGSDLAALLHQDEHVARAQDHLRHFIRDLLSAGGRERRHPRRHPARRASELLPPRPHRGRHPTVENRSRATRHGHAGRVAAAALTRSQLRAPPAGPAPTEERADKPSRLFADAQRSRSVPGGGNAPSLARRSSVVGGRKRRRPHSSVHPVGDELGDGAARMLAYEERDLRIFGRLRHAHTSRHALDLHLDRVVVLRAAWATSCGSSSSAGGACRTT